MHKKAHEKPNFIIIYYQILFHEAESIRLIIISFDIVKFDLVPARELASLKNGILTCLRFRVHRRTLLA